MGSPRFGVMEVIVVSSLAAAQLDKIQDVSTVVRTFVLLR